MSLFQPFTYFGTAISATLNYAYRNDPFSASLVFATPCSLFSSLGMTYAWSDVEANIRGTGSNKTVATSASLQTNTTYIKFDSDGYVESLAMTASSATPTPSIFSQNSTDFNFGSGNFTIECWHNPGAGTSARRMFFQKYVTGQLLQCELNWNLGLNNTNAMGFAYDNSAGETGVYAPATASLASNTWTHYALVRNGATSFIAYINGVPTVGSTVNRTLNTTTTPAFLLGGNYNTPYQTGYVQDYRIYKGVAKYTASFTPPQSMIITV